MATECAMERATMSGVPECAECANKIAQKLPGTSLKSARSMVIFSTSE